VSKPLGLLVAGTGVWLLSYAGVLPTDGIAWWLLAGVLGTAGWAVLLKRRAEVTAFFRENWKAVLVGEALFLAVFIAWTAYRAYDPAIAGTEKPMDFMLLNASYAAQAAPPEDAWLSGQPVAYYYFGYWMFAGMAKLGAVPTYEAFNLALGLIAAMSAAAIFSLVFTLVRRSGGGLRAGVLAGLAGAGLLIVTASLAGWWELLANFGAGGDRLYDWLAIKDLHPAEDTGGWRSDSFWWWWRASRVINTFDASGAGLDFTIEEFPFFSLLLGDLHPHLMSIPFVLTGLAAAYCVLVSKGRWGTGWIASNTATAVALALIIGAAGFINAWDIAFLGALVLGAAALKTHRETRTGIIGAGVRAIPALALIVIAALVIYSPFYFGTFKSQVAWPPIGPAEFGTRPVHFLTVWGFLLVLSGPALTGIAWPALRQHWRMALAVVWGRQLEGPRPVMQPFWLAAAAVVVPYLIWAIAHLEFNDLARPADTVTRLVATLPLMAATVGLFTALVVRSRQGAPGEEQFLLLATLLAVYLLYGAELFYVHDLFGNRMNTVFKFYYQAWIILSVAGAYGLWWWWRAHPSLRGAGQWASRTAAVLACVLLVGCLYYPIAAAVSKTGSFRASPTLDGLRYVSESAPAERRAIEFLRHAARPGDRVVEAVGGSYTEFGRVSGSTGLAAVLGWPGHERQWRGDTSLYSDRERDVERLYTTPDAAEARRLIEMYGVDYVIVGRREPEKYPALNAAKFDELGERVFDEDGFVIYRVSEAASGS
jgi:YYY domain-containing protein